MKPCIRAVVPPPSTLPTATDERGMGATSISLRKPNSRSQMMEMAENMAVNSTVMHTMPGYMKVMYFVSPLPKDLNAACRPVPMRTR